jgi:hypothetical protein
VDLFERVQTAARDFVATYDKSPTRLLLGRLEFEELNAQSKSLLGLPISNIAMFYLTSGPIKLELTEDESYLGLI